ncbi:3-hydroxybutyryl-CoA dehydratase [Clostridium pasteurianum DSM 525 = ATCC 6013]|uniref:short-chain-enoyl-CoA hydratase n=1 Tax=Clostridium pasteurianum DSM 525 = ATCC 6013 TaxID=1262449 RepID=A0A0H3J5M0_CLOPA|nr:enoyl-CoA hydratase-related protein [Clostridium pasteurianum]AJA47198.1 3-hydroxybutyryl-CoA dehydratase [Clostridium pasteurianum DSM 525 = ATCC 6013]AJA51186.1 3-hydroxybutyryl-CoA dehydratase [Clostridium pasteurianum DSM 525 = ATCC 6013]AOZ74552.1 crotonase [Clostridium pasteurianum DSM 525 = ATCC 6013]AOZ78349.1 crotonase [Clostridium pasteurianum]ELP59417.1 3-hydroxybutyryl-CoA dehydratase [Clostridium pasteurianum DSM 525 = ATCC 6013]
MGNIIFEEEDGIEKVTINRPKALNALNSETLKELGTVINDISVNDGIKAVIITGSGSKAFVAGADIAEMSTLNSIEATNFSRLAQNVFSQIENLPKLVVAAVNGFALGGGCELAMACDVRFASKKAKFGQPEVNLGILPSFGGTQRLPKLVGKGIAKELIFSTDMITADEAYRIGLANKVYEPEELLVKSQEFAEKVMTKSPWGVKLAKACINNGLDVDLEAGLKYEANSFGLCFSTEDQKEGMKAFLEKRKADFKGL